MTQQAPSKTAGDAILQTALQIEDIGKDFYEAFAAATADPKVHQLCLRLAAAESGHRKTFQQMRSELARLGRTILLHDDQLAEGRQTAKAIVAPDPETVRRLALWGDVGALLDMAITMEQASIRFYRSFADSVPDPGVLETVIREEQEHLQLLQAARPADAS